MRPLVKASFLLLCLCAVALLSAPLVPPAYADTEEVKSQIDDAQQKITDLQNQITQLQNQLNETTAQKQTLQSAIQELDLTSKKITAQIQLTQTQINRVDLQIRTLSGSIATTTDGISTDRQGLSALLRDLDSGDQKPLALTVLSGGTLAEIFNEAAAIGAARDELRLRMQELSALKNTLQTTKNATQSKRDELAGLQRNLKTQQQSLALARQSQNELLKQTKNQESSYQALIAQKKAEESAFEAELIRLAASLGSADTTSAPKPGKGILNWPLDNVFITQYFGNTKFAQSGAYSGNGHNGMDFRAAIGTPVKSALSGTVQEINQGSVKYCQYGKWVLVRHDNGLSTLYAHLSSIAVSKGQQVETGQLVGYSGDTGYATGPHLHLTVYVSSAVSFKQYKCNSGYSAYIPIAPLNAYLNPLLYF